MPLHVTGTLIFAPSRLDELRTAFAEHVRLSRAEPGCLRFDYTEAPEGTITLDELYTDTAAFDAHKARAMASAWWSLRDGVTADIHTDEVP